MTAYIQILISESLNCYPDPASSVILSVHIHILILRNYFMKAIKCRDRSTNRAHYTMTQTVTNVQSLSSWKDLLTWATTPLCLFLWLIAPRTNCSLKLCRQCVHCAQRTPISETPPVLHQYSAKWVRTIIQDMNFNMTLIEPSIQVFI